jgi:hypothetical protein
MGAMVNLLIGITIALLPLYRKVAGHDFTRTSMNNLLVIIFGVLCFLMPKKERHLPLLLYVAMAYGLFTIVYNQWEPTSIVVMLQTFYVASGILFFANFYERYSEIGTKFILDGMAIGCLIQCFIVLMNYVDIHIYFEFLKLFYSNLNYVGSAPIGIGSLGNSNLLASYVAITSIALCRKKWRFFLPFPVCALIIANSMMGYATFLCGAIYFVLSHSIYFKKSWAYFAAAVAMITVYFTGIHGMDSYRFKAWGTLFEMVDLPHFLFGKGPGWFYQHGIVISHHEIMMQEHNAFLSAFNMFGIIGIALLIPSFLRYLTLKDSNKIFPAILFAAFINSYGHFTLHQSTVAIIIIVTASICLAEGRNNVINMDR